MTAYDYPILGLLSALSLFVGIVAGLVMFVIAIIRWDMNSWKYVLLVGGFLLPIAGIAAGWIALLAGGLKRRVPAV